MSLRKLTPQEERAGIKQLTCEEAWETNKRWKKQEIPFSGNEFFSMSRHFKKCAECQKKRHPKTKTYVQKVIVPVRCESCGHENWPKAVE